MSWLINAAHAASEQAPGYADKGLFASEYLWLTIALVGFVAVIWKMGGFRQATAMLDKRIDEVRNQLEEAERLREEAQSLLAQYQREHRDAMSEAEGIVTHAGNEAQRLRQKAEADLQESIKRREAQAKDRIAQAEAQAVRDIRNAAVEVAMTASRNALAESVDAAAQEKLVQQAVDELPKRLN